MNTDSWKWFELINHFDMYAGQYYPADSYEFGSTPLISASDTTNGVMAWTNLEPKFPANSITIGKVGMASFVQPTPFCASPDVTVLVSKEKLNTYQLLFVKSVMDAERFRWNYGNQIRLNDSQKIKIKLPAATNNNPDWQYMEDYAKNVILPSMPAKARSVWKGTYNSGSVNSEHFELLPNDWEVFNLNEIFRIEYGSKLDICKVEENPFSEIAFVTRTANNNGVKLHVNKYNDLEPYPAGILTIALGGSIGKTFIQTTPFYTCQNVAVLTPTNELNIYHKIFLKTIIEKECSLRFVAFGRELNSHIKNDFTLKLPATTNANGEKVPDWQWMEDYIKGLPFSEAI